MSRIQKEVAQKKDANWSVTGCVQKWKDRFYGLLDLHVECEQVAMRQHYTFAETCCP